MSTPTLTPTGPAGPTGPADRPEQPPHRQHRAGPVLALARFEARELLFQVPVLVFFLVLIAYTVVRIVTLDGMDDFPVLHTTDREGQGAAFLPAIALLVCTNAAALRARRHHTLQQFDVLAMEPWRRTLAHALSAVPYGALTALVVGVGYGWEAVKPGAIGHGSFGELATGPLTVLLAGVTGVLLARLVPTPFAPILFVIGFYVLVLAVTSATHADSDRVGWLSPIRFSTDGGGDPVPSDLLGRPAGWHALYVLGLCALVTCAALLRAGGTRVRSVQAATALALAVTVTGAVGQFPRGTDALETARTTASRTPEKVQSCTDLRGSRYCSFPEWNGTRDAWAEVVDRLRTAAGGSAAHAPLTVRQRIDATGGVEADAALPSSTVPGVVTVGTRWGGTRVPEFAVGAATVLVAGTEDEAAMTMCDVRPATIMWLVLSTDRDPLNTFGTVRLDDSVTGSGLVLTPTDGLSLSAEQTALVRALLDRPRAETTRQVKAHWSALTSARTPATEAAALLGVTLPKGVEPCEK
ncbi:ABC transporter permease [Streptomyces sp. NPDC086091]|uniref:ABC transporter permease n=1 Tax=Streptomyces sp. NPDC086091 TaxID=3365751 RepID=UPI0037F24ACB